jgi:hypothetical protein
MNNPIDDIPQAERRRIIAEERRASTYHQHAIASTDDTAGGRFATEGKPTVLGSSPISYPQQPASSPSNQAALVPDEPTIDGSGEGDRLGYCIDNPGSPAAVAATPAAGEGDRPISSRSITHSHRFKRRA